MILASLLLSLPILADIPVSAPVLRPATGVQWGPAVASNGSDALAVWQDERGAIHPSSPNYFDQEIYAARIGADGAPAPDFDVAPSADQDRSPAVVWNGAEYVVAHVVQSRDFTFRGLRFTRGAESVLVPLPGLPINDAGPLALAWNGEEYLAVLSAYEAGNYSLYGVLVDRSFRQIGPPVRITSGFVSLGKVASDGNGFLVTWLNGSLVTIANVSPSGAVAVQPPLSDLAARTRPAVAWNGQRYLVTWSDTALRARFVEREGTPSSPVLELAPNAGATSVAWNGSSYLVALSVDDGMFALRLDADGKPLDAQPFAIPGTNKYGGPTVTAMGSRFVVAWADADSTAYSVVNGSTASPRTILAHSLGLQEGARGVFDGASFAFVWMEEGTTYFGRVTPDGKQLDGSGVALGEAFPPQLAFNGETYVVALRDRLVRIDRDAHVLDTKTLAAPRAMETDGRDFLMLTAPAEHLRPVLLTAQGVLLPQPDLEDFPYPPLAAGLAWDGAHYVAVWAQPTEPDCYKCGRRYEVHTALLDRSGRAASPIRTIFSARLPIFPAMTVLVASGGGFTVTLFGDGVTAYAAGIDAAGRPSAATQLPDRILGDLVWNGSAFLTPNLRLTPAGVPDAKFALGPLDARNVAFVRGAPRLTLVYDRPVPAGGAGSIERVFFDFVQEVRRRAR